MGQTPSNTLKAGMLMIIFFLSWGWGVTVVQYGNYRTAKENQITKMQADHAQETINLYNRIIDGQTRRQDQLDSTIKEVKTILEHQKP